MATNNAIKELILKLVNIKGVNEEQEQILLSELVGFVKSFAKLFKTIRDCFSKKQG